MPLNISYIASDSSLERFLILLAQALIVAAASHRTITSTSPMAAFRPTYDVAGHVEHNEEYSVTSGAKSRAEHTQQSGHKGSTGGGRGGGVCIDITTFWTRQELFVWSMAAIKHERVKGREALGQNSAKKGTLDASLMQTSQSELPARACTIVAQTMHSSMRCSFHTESFPLYGHGFLTLRENGLGYGRRCRRIKSIYR